MPTARPSPTPTLTVCNHIRYRRQHRRRDSIGHDVCLSPQSKRTPERDRRQRHADRHLSLRRPRTADRPRHHEHDAGGDDALHQRPGRGTCWRRQTPPASRNGNTSGSTTCRSPSWPTCRRHRRCGTFTPIIGRPIRMSDATKAIVWSAEWLPFGGAQSIAGSASLDLRFPGQWFQIEAGLAYNWHRHYDASSGRYLGPDPVGMPDGPSRWGYAKQLPTVKTDAAGLTAIMGPFTPLPTSNASSFVQRCVISNPLDPRCRKVKDECIAECSDSSLPSGDYGFRFWNCVNACMARHGC
jgi:RHS repeat-associated protein